MMIDTLEKPKTKKPSPVLEQKKKAEPKLSVQNLNVWYHDFQALKEINTSFQPNTINALIGPSGCGKSTFLRLFNRMNDYIEGFRAEGEILLDGNDIYKERTNIVQLRKEVGMVFQKPNPFPKSIFENVAFGLRVHGHKNKDFLSERVERALQQADLWDQVKDNLKKSALTLSGGQQQRLCIARTLAVEPDVILMDEPTSALDPISTARLENLLFDLKNDFTIIIVTHNLQQAGRVSDYTSFFYLGEMIEQNNTHELFTNPKHKKTENYLTGRFG